ncbi:MAG: hypothetical protein OEW83_14880, partial [Acidimicrobiia bacterium]|nr:hypothetical protein [Acidimicrobiia bacterium]
MPDLAVGHVPAHAIAGQDHRGTQRESFHITFDDADVDSIAHAELILDDQHDARDQILDETLCTKADGDAGDSERRKDRYNTDSEDVENDDRGNPVDQGRGRTS